MIEFLEHKKFGVLRAEDNPEHDVISLMNAVKEVKMKMRKNMEERIKMANFLKKERAGTPE